MACISYSSTAGTLLTNFEKLYTDFKNLFDLCHYTDDALKEKILKNIKDGSITDGIYLFGFRLVIFKFEVCFDEITYVGYKR
ncbi:MAG: hypothetical protein ACI8TE_000895 [Francisella sp.]|jgi:hypothetical protein